VAISVHGQAVAGGHGLGRDWVRHVEGLAALFIVPLAGAIGSLRGRPLAAPAKAFFLWVPLCVVIFVVGLMGLF
jgi:hypothetical protein